MKALKQFDPDVDKRVLHAAYKDKTAGDGFIRRCLAVGDINVQLERAYGDRLEFFTQSECKEEDDNYFPKPLPHAYVTIADPSRPDNDPYHYFLEFCESATPTFVYKQRLEEYAEYAETPTWQEATGTTLPEVALICDNSLKHRLTRLANEQLENTFEEGLSFRVITKDQISMLLEPKKKARER